MTTKYIIMSLLFVFAMFLTVNAQKGTNDTLKKESLKVWGECGMCKKKIEQAAKNAGAEAAAWDEESKTLLLSFNIYKTNSTKIQQAIATAGYDTKDFSATRGAYNKLPECCHYARKQIVQQETANCCSKEMNCSKDAGCCTHEKCDKNSSSCKDMAVCKEKGCCKS